MLSWLWLVVDLYFILYIFIYLYIVVEFCERQIEVLFWIKLLYIGVNFDWIYFVWVNCFCC